MRERALQLLELADEYDFRIWSAIGSCLLGAALTGLGQAASGLASVREGMSAYQGLVAPPVFWPMLLFVQAGASGRAGVAAEGLAPIRTAIQLMGGSASPGVLVPELLLLQGDLQAVVAGAGSATAVDSYATALASARRLETRMSELRALTRLSRTAPAAQRAAWSAELATVAGTFTEGASTKDLVEAHEALAAG